MITTLAQDKGRERFHLETMFLSWIDPLRSYIIRPCGSPIKIQLMKLYWDLSLRWKCIWLCFYAPFSMKEVGSVFSMRESSVWETQLRAREANELLSQNETTGCQSDFPPFIFWSLDYDEILFWGAQWNSIRDTLFCMIPASPAHGEVIAYIIALSLFN